MTRALIAGAVALCMLACGGKSNSDAFDDDASGSATTDSGDSGSTASSSNGGNA